jgi:hypothetical protein
VLLYTSAMENLHQVNISGGLTSKIVLSSILFSSIAACLPIKFDTCCPVLLIQEHNSVN